MMDLIQSAPRAVWSSGAGRLTFGRSHTDPRGFAIHPLPHLILEDGSAHDTILETHPRWTDDGWIRGEFHILTIADSDHLIGRFGFIQPTGPPQTNGVTLTIGCDGRTIVQLSKQYTGRLNDLDVDLAPFAGHARTISIEVAANGDSTQDWLVWTRLAVGPLRGDRRTRPMTA